MTTNFYKPVDPLVRRGVAKSLLDINSIQINSEHQFILTTGKKSPVYVDCRKIISFPEIRDRIISIGLNTIPLIQDFDVIAGGETAGIPYASLIAKELNLPMVYVRKNRKTFGTKSLIEGVIKKNQKVLLVEDLATDGGSKVEFVNAIKKAGGICEHVFVIFFYGETTNRCKVFFKNELSLTYLCCWKDVIDYSVSQNMWDENTLLKIKDYLFEKAK